MIEQQLVIGHSDGGWQITPPQSLPLDRLLNGKSPDEALEILPMLFNICATAQKIAARLAFGLPVGKDLCSRLARERIREHRRKLYYLLPQLLRHPVPSSELPQDLPQTPQAFETWVHKAQDPAAASLHSLWQWDEHIGRVHLPLLPQQPSQWPEIGRLENSLASSYSDHPLLEWVEARKGRGPLWRLAACVVDLAGLLAGKLPEPEALSARGRLFAKARLAQGRVESFSRLTPTDFMLAPGGLLLRMLETLSSDDMRVACVVQIADPCVSWRMEEGTHA